MIIFAETSEELGLSPGLDLLLHAGKIPLHFVHANRQSVLQGEVLGMLGQDRLERDAHGQDDAMIGSWISRITGQSLPNLRLWAACVLPRLSWRGGWRVG